MSNTNNKLVVFLDTIGRTIIGKLKSETDQDYSVENPAIIHVQPNPATNQLQLQIIPLFFKEFLSDKDKSTVWAFKKSNITLSDVDTFAQQFVVQYEQMWVPLAPPPQEETKVVKLFDES